MDILKIRRYSIFAYYFFCSVFEALLISCEIFEFSQKNCLQKNITSAKLSLKKNHLKKISQWNHNEINIYMKKSRVQFQPIYKNEGVTVNSIFRCTVTPSNVTDMQKIYTIFLLEILITILLRQKISKNANFSKHFQ